MNKLTLVVEILFRARGLQLLLLQNRQRVELVTEMSLKRQTSIAFEQNFFQTRLLQVSVIHFERRCVARFHVESIDDNIYLISWHALTNKIVSETEHTSF